ncbi:MAG: RagB/SusD family nutrient uptake outer membrane protein [Bacteroidetes bacterium]|nr:RagB/SusD family nutrient uptake outer membrane protein [Bacteroidota bacterium]
MLLSTFQKYRINLYKTNRNRHRGEAFFARALSYFYIVRVWGEAPLINFPYDSDTLDFEVPSAPVERIWAQITADLDSASLYLPNEYNSENSYNFDNFRLNRGRATRAAAWAAQTDVYMWLKNYQKADSVATKFETLTRYYNSSSKKWNLAVNFGDISLRRDKLITYPAEGIFELQFNKDEGAESNMSTLWHSNFNTFGASDKFINLFESQDSRKVFYDANKVYKFFGPVYANYQTINKDQNIILYRLADVLLLRAEALNKLGNKTKAVELMNIIRARAMLPASSVTESSTVDEIENALLDERAKELLGEGKRWFDLVRTGKAIPVMQPINNLSDPLNIFGLYMLITLELTLN